MRRFLGCALAILLVIAIPATSAHADPAHGLGAKTPKHHKKAHHDPYPGAVTTSTWVISSPARVGKPETISVDVSAFGYAQPTGSVTVTVAGKGYSDTETASVSGSWAIVETSPITRSGFYSVSATYSPTAGSVFKASKGYSGFFAASGYPWFGWPWW